ncbi:MAG TPA: DUF1761 domain-containing protein [Chitinophagales bacterium]|nr:DUF1761 domain-containing protein [Chitinophagales bacterium]
MDFNWIVLVGAALVPLVIGFIWYHPKTFANPWMRAAGLTPESLQGGNMPVVFALTFVLSLMLALLLHSMVIHQYAIYSLVADMTPEQQEPLIADFNDKFGTLYRTFRHGAFHGVLIGLFFVLPVMGVNALFERKGFKYIAINVGFWTVSLALMGGIICQWA